MRWNPEVKGKVGDWQYATFCERDLENFLEAVGEDKDFWLSRKVAPPMFFWVFRKGRPDPEIQGYSALLHGRQEFEIQRLLRVGEKIKYRTRIKDIYERKSSSLQRSMVFVVFETEYFTEDGKEKIAVARTTVIYIG